ncbi:diguanylate cyclase regulator RdcB family protein [Citrobacter sp. S2-9]|uniref:Diguanylate cyclase regulator RdcB family protein n=1 Tax=Citrobacter enshiensis TaxID=2971264 RepID=A0ABT8PZ14_9ENTR|nr:diguanylate cyclase regulator RdcB family protein [Citrobacter enshiensis]MDN8601634.1 diguanylate cyclase regulator RdcB family protein [Citrobacter enshiensis]
MTNTLREGPGRMLECIHPKFMVSLVQGEELKRTGGTLRQQPFRDRLLQEMLAHAQPGTWVMTGGGSEHLLMRLTLMEKLAGMFDPGHLALTRIAHHLTLLQHSERPRGYAIPGILQQLDALTDGFTRRCAYKEKALTQRGLTVPAGEHSEQIFTRWRAGAYDGWSLPGRCFVALEELRWGAFGDACRLANADVVSMLKDNLCAMASHALARSIHAAPTTRHYYSQWLNTPNTQGTNDDNDLLSWLGDWCDADKHPVCWSVTQRWKNVALGMPRLCSAQRLAHAMVEEIFAPSPLVSPEGTERI